MGKETIAIHNGRKVSIRENIDPKIGPIAAKPMDKVIKNNLPIELIARPINYSPYGEYISSVYSFKLSNNSI